MKVSQLGSLEGKPVILNHLRLESDWIEDEDWHLIEKVLLPAAIEYVKSTCSITEREMNKHEDITIAVLVLVGDMYSDRARTGKTVTVNARNYSNRTVETILGLYDNNLL